MKYLYRFLLIFLLLLISNESFAQLTKLWEVEIIPEGTGLYASVDIDEVKFDSEGNIIVAGMEDLGGSYGEVIFAAKISQDGIIEWKNTFDGNNYHSTTNYVNGLHIKSNDDIILFAKLQYQNVIKYVSDGNLMGFDEHNFNWGEAPLFNKVFQDLSGEYRSGAISSPSYGSYSHYIKFDSQGNLADSRRELISGVEVPYSKFCFFDNSLDKSMLLFGSCSNYSCFNVAQLDAYGEFEWNYENSVPRDVTNRFFIEVLRDNTGYLYLATNTRDENNEKNANLIKLDPDGGFLWEVSTPKAWLNDIEFDQGGNIWVALSPYSDDQNANLTLLKKISSAGATLATVQSTVSKDCTNLLCNDENEIYSIQRLAHQGIYIYKYDWEGKYIDRLLLNSNNYGNIWSTLSFDPNGELVVSFRYLYSEYICKIADLTTTVEDKELINHYSISQNYPNPFNPSTKIAYRVPKTTQVKLEVYNSIGELVGTLVNSKKIAGEYQVQWDGSNLSSGIYFVRMASPDYISSIKMMLIK